ncbi:MAG: biotin transporter BioY [Lachnospirales bacterium]
MKTRDMTKIALITALLCVLAPLSIPIGPVPISFTNLVLYFSLCIIGTKKTAISYIVYYLLGVVGLPVFSNFTGGFAKAAGPTGGYLVGFIFMILIGGIFISKFNNKIIKFIGLVIGTAIAYIFGTIWYTFVTKTGYMEAFAVCVFPFIIGDLVKIVIAVIIGDEIKKRIAF